MKTKKKSEREFAIYKGDELLIIGTDKECAEELNVQVEYIHWLTTPTAKRRLAKRKKPENCLVGILIEDDEQDAIH